MAAIFALIGGLGLFLLGMQLMTDGLKAAAGDALRGFIERSTRTRLRAFAAGVAVTALVQSSSAVTVAVIGFVAAGLMTLGQAMFVVFGSNVGTTFTGWLVALIGVKVDVGALALPLIGAGMALRIGARGGERLRAAGEALAGFGAFFLGVGVLVEAFSGLAPALAGADLARLGPFAAPAFLLAGALMTALTQSSSAAMAITLTATAGAGLPLSFAAAAAIGVNIGTTSTAAFAALGAGAEARRVAIAHIIFNLATGAAALLLLPALLPAAEAIAGLFPGGGDAASLAAFHTLFNLFGVALMWPFAGGLARWLERRFAAPGEAAGRPKHLDPSLAETPALALPALVLETTRLLRHAFMLAAASLDRPAGGVAIAAQAQAQAGLYRLGAAIRDFIGRLTLQKLPADVVAALPDIVRAVQHAEEIAAASLSANGPPPRGAEAILGPAASRFAAAVGAALDVERLAAPSRPEVAAVEAEMEDAYQAAKARLLAASARGELPVHDMERALRETQRRRTLARAAARAMRRLAGWTGAAARAA